MKTNILSFLLGICIMLLISATAQTTGLFTVKPAMPKLTYAYAARDNAEAVQVVLKYSKQGYVLHKLEYNSNGNSIIVMYKY